MKTFSIKKELLGSTVLTAALTMAAFQASVSSAVAQEEGEEDVITVTGSRINRANIEATSPVITIGAARIEARGTTDTIDLLNTLPSAFAAQTTAFANGATGTSTLDLRGLGPTRTLVLVDGKRLPPGGALAGFAADINQIPPQLVERVEVVTGGASAVYGSDAIAGVANFILKQDFQGIELDLQYGINQSDNDSGRFRDALNDVGEDAVQGSVTDNDTYQFTAIAGTNFADDRGNITAYFNYAQNDGIQQGDRDFARCATEDAGEREVSCLGSNAGPFPTSFVLTSVRDSDGDPVPLVDADGNTLGRDAMGNLISGASFSLEQDDSLSTGLNNGFNFNPDNPIRRAVERFNAGFSVDYDITDAVTAYMDFNFTQSSSPQIIAPSAAFGSTINRVGCDNPLLSDELLALICGQLDEDTGLYSRDVDGDGFAQAQIRRRFVEGGPRTDDRERTNLRFVGGFKGTLDETWDWDVFVQHADTSLSRLQTNQVTLDALEKSLDIIEDDDGNFVCRSAFDDPDTTVNEATDPDCVPFTSAYSNAVPSPEGLADYVDTPTLTTGNSQQTVIGGTISGDLFKYGIKSPMADEGISFLAGVEYRNDALRTQADGVAASGNLVGSGGATTPVDAQTSLYEIFFETSIPLVSGRPWAEQLNLTGAYRFSDYESQDDLTDRDGGNFDVDTYAVGISWVPQEDVRFRAQFQRATRAPNVGELFAPQNSGLTSLEDPCSGPTPTATQAQCVNTGLTAAQFGNIPVDSGQLNTLTGGNPDLRPETADTYTVGVIYQPSQVDGLTVSLDYFDITLEDQVGTIPTSFILNSCLDTGDPQFCDLIQRGPDGTLTFFPREEAFIEATSRNIAEVATSGLDLQIEYSHDIGTYGSLSYDYNSTYLIDLEQTLLPGTAPFDCVGFYQGDCGNPNFDYRHTLEVTWDTPWKVRTRALWRHFSSVSFLNENDDGRLISSRQVGEVFAGSRISSVDYLDTTVYYDVLDNVTLRLGANNVFDSDPPVVPTFTADGVNNEANTIAGVYDAGGRHIFLGAELSF